MTNTITSSEAKILIPEMIEKREITDTVVVEENGQPLAAVITAEDYAFLVEARRREAVRAAVLREWERKFDSPQWREAIVAVDDFRSQFADVDEDKLMADFDEAIAAVRKQKPYPRQVVGIVVREGHGFHCEAD